MSSIARSFKLARHWFWIAPVFVGLAFIAGGVYMFSEGRSAHDDVTETVSQENITVSGDSEEFAGEVIDSADKAQAQADVILGHTLAGSGGYLYAEQGRFLQPEGNYMLTNGTYMDASGTGTTTDVSQALTDEDGNPINYTTDESLAALNRSDQPVRAWTNNRDLAALDAEGNPISNPLRDTALTSAQLRTSLGVAVMGFKVADLVTGLGAFLVVVGIVNILFLAPVTYYAAEIANEREGVVAEPKPVAAEKAEQTGM
jgi:hypothetical protein